MKVPSTVMGVALVGAAALGLFQLKHAVERLEDDLAGLNREFLASVEGVHVLRAEWSYLNRPERVSALAADYLALQPMTAEQIGDIETLPLRADAVAPPGSRVLADTGGVR